MRYEYVRVPRLRLNNLSRSFPGKELLPDGSSSFSPLIRQTQHSTLKGGIT